MSQVVKAYDFAKEALAGKVDLIGVPLFNHCMQVADLLPFTAYKEIAFLHEIFEETDITFDQLCKEFGIRTASAVQELTWNMKEPYMEYIKKMQSPVAKKVKRADLISNLINIQKVDDPILVVRQTKEMKEALDFLNKLFIEEPTILITGGTGTIGKALVMELFKRMYTGKIIVTGSTDRSCLLMQKLFPYIPNLRVRQGNVRDVDRYVSIMKDDQPKKVIHAAAMKRIDVCEQEPLEAHKTNVQGTINILNLAMRYGCKQFLFISTDKAVEPTTWYGITKKQGEHYTCLMNNRKKDFETKCVRYGNVYGSQGSVIDVWNTTKRISLRNPYATRFFFSSREAAGLVLEAFNKPGRISIPCSKAIYMFDLANYYAKKFNTKVTELPEIREKLHEKLYTEDEVFPMHIYPEQKANSNESLVEDVNKFINKMESTL